YRINTNCSLPSLTITDDQFTLSSPNRDHRVDRFNSRLQRLSYRLTIDYAWSFTLNRHFESLSCNRSFPVNRLSKGIHNTTQHTFSHLNGSNTIGSLNRVTFFNLIGRSQKNNTNIIFF